MLLIFLFVLSNELPVRGCLLAGVCLAGGHWDHIGSTRNSDRGRPGGGTGTGGPPRPPSPPNPRRG